jgi:predicted dehydrogenase
MPLLSIGVIGCGRIAREVHLRVLQKLPGVRVVALAEPDATALNRAQQLAPDATPFADAESLLAYSPVQAVLISLPNALHAPLAVRAFDAGKHVYLEKPIGLNIGEARDVAAAWQRAKTVGAIGFNYRFNPLLCEARKLLQAGAIGQLIAIRSSFCAPLGELPAWKTRRESGGGVLLDLASHHLDLVRYLTSQEVAEVWAQTRSRHSEDDTATVALRLQNGTLMQSFFSQGATERDLWEFEGDSGRIRVDRYAMTQAEITRPGELGLGARARRVARGCGPTNAARAARYTLRKLREPNNEASYRVAVTRFARAIEKQQNNLVPTPLDGLRNMEIVTGLEEAARSGCGVKL